ncbi:sugar ABC transporter permease [Sphaerotilus montanus]|uniref:Glucose/mannose transport system permease protein n=1 Tax=Sphaerotilus montanus TaxID=522889 RepID=A0A7Y9QWM9_9BURK|nr:sugar ABC transporter permease [Sphaerotilus montanus]NYG31404.1 glucose/mannose transport system permease protein [Sphaerotilus montanus]NZD55385.1 sugar ABC transporter permease [Sphaerotilus montanus]
MARSARPKRLNLALHAALLPLAITALLAYVGSVIWSIRISLSSSKLFPRNDWVGLDQFQRLFETDRWIVSLQHMGVLAVVYILGVLVLGTLMAIFIDQQVRAESWFRTIFLYPYAMSFVVTGLIWQWLFNPTLGLQNALRLMGWESFTLDWTVQPDMVLYAIGLAMVWQGSGTTMAILLAALRGVDEEQWKAARLEGVSKPRYYLSVVLPQLGPAYATAFVLLAVALVRTFDVVAVMTSGGPGDASEVPAKFIIDHLFGRNNIGLASAASVVMLVTVFTVLAPLLYWRSKVQARQNAGH